MPRDNRGRSRRPARGLPSRRERSPSPAGQESPIAFRTRSRAPLQGRQTEHQLPQRSRRRRIPDSTRERSRSPVDRSNGEREDIQAPPVNPQHREEAPTCSVCLEQLRQDGPSMMLQCSHVLHDSCMRRLMQESETCPLCHQSIVGSVAVRFNVPDGGTGTFHIPVRMWARQPALHFGFIDGFLNILGAPGQEFPPSNIRGRRAVRWDMPNEDRLSQRSPRRQNHDSTQRDRSRSPVDRRQPESRGIQSPPRSDLQREDCPECSICLEGLGEGVRPARLPCSHQFHHRCINRWLLETRTCPLCRHSISVNIRWRFNLPYYGDLFIIAPYSFWSRQPSLHLTFQNDRPNLVYRLS